MYYTQCLLPIVLPILFWAAYHYYKDRHLPEPPGYLLLALLLGVGAFYVGLGMYTALGLFNVRFDAYLLAESNLPGLFAYAMLVIGPVEEAAKLLPFVAVVLHFRAFDEPVDGIIYASFIGLGFGAVENFYALRYLDGIEAWARGFVGPALHIVFASIWGYAVGRAWLCRKPLLPVLLLSFGISAAIHGVYDFFVLGFAPMALPLAAAVIIAVWIWRLYRIRDLHALPPGPCRACACCESREPPISNRWTDRCGSRERRPARCARTTSCSALA
ncbi:MAG: PrsW family intramembrane metalloprotease, partial [Xanthomonadales bacterium]|nr:PrsW family intramembrane metalloprotease [Xanthomonadales bacterium]